MEENNKCIICCSSVNELFSDNKQFRKIDLSTIQTFYQILLNYSSCSYLSSLKTDNVWSTTPKFLSFCVSCELKVLKVMYLNLNIVSSKTQIDELVVQIKTNILNSMVTSSNRNKNICKMLSLENFGYFDSLSLSDKVDCFRSLAVVDYNPDVIIQNYNEGSVELPSKNIAYNKFNCYWNNISGGSNLKSHAILKRKRVIPTRKLKKPTERSKFFNCINCCQDCSEVEQCELECDKFYTYCEILNINYRHPYFNWSISSSLAGIPRFCDSCYSSVELVCDLYQNRKEMLKSIDKVILQIKWNILVSMSHEKHKINFCRRKVSRNEMCEPDYFRSAIIQEFNPDLLLFQIQPPKQLNQLSKNGRRIKLSRRFQTDKRPTLKNSIYTLLKDGECINLHPEMTEPTFPLTDDETQLYLEYDVSNEKFKCRECSQVFGTKYSADKHVNKFHKQIKMFECKYCGKQYYLKTDCAYHITGSHKDERELDDTIAAPLLDLKLSTSDGIIDLGRNAAPKLKKGHIKKLANGLGFQCATCSIVHKQRNSLVKHIKGAHFNMTRYQCEFCGFRKIERSSIVYHIQRVHKDEMAKRDIVFDSSAKFFKQRLKKKKVPNPPVTFPGVNLIERETPSVEIVEEYFTAAGLGFTCNYCGAFFNRRIRMIQHVECVHLGVVTCECAICEKRFYRISACNIHVQKHHDEKETHKKAMLISGDQNNMKESTLDESMQTSTTSVVALQSQNVESMNDMNEMNENGLIIKMSNNSIGKIKTEEVETSDDFLQANTWQDLEIGVDSFKGKKKEINFYSQNGGSILPIHNVYVKREHEQETEEINVFINETLKVSPATFQQQSLNESAVNEEDMIQDASVDKTPLVYTLVKEGDVVVLPEVDMSEIYKHFKKIESDEYLYECIKCGRILNTECKVRRHAEDIHALVKRYQCSNCLKLFNSKHSCSTHFIQQHTGHKLYQCSICGNSFKSNLTLRHHTNSHLNRQFECTICHKKFASNHRLEMHCKNVHKANTLKL